jgi:hypothetical protein
MYYDATDIILIFKNLKADIKNQIDQINSKEKLNMGNS